MKNIRLRDQDVDALLKRDLRIKAGELQRNWPDFDTYPAELQESMLDLHFNTGSVTPKRWPKLNDAIQNKDKQGIIREMNRKTKHEGRNDAIKEKLQEVEMDQWR